MNIEKTMVLSKTDDALDNDSDVIRVKTHFVFRITLTDDDKKQMMEHHRAESAKECEEKITGLQKINVSIDFF